MIEYLMLSWMQLVDSLGCCFQCIISQTKTLFSGTGGFWQKSQSCGFSAGRLSLPSELSAVVASCNTVKHSKVWDDVLNNTWHRLCHVQCA